MQRLHPERTVTITISPPEAALPPGPSPATLLTSRLEPPPIPAPVHPPANQPHRQARVTAPARVRYRAPTADPGIGSGRS